MAPGLRELSIAICLFLAGCSTNEADPSEVLPAENPLPPLPPSQYVNATMPYSSVTAPGVAGGSCEEQTCHRYPFPLDRTANLTVFLEWYPGANDLDLYLFKAGAEHASGSTANSRGEFLRTLVGPGEYEVVVQGYFSGVALDGLPDDGTPYRLEYHFDEPRATNP